MPWETDKSSSAKSAGNVRDINSATKKKISDALAVVYDRPERERSLKVDRKDLSEPVSFRMSVTQLRLADEIVGQRDDPLLKTRTDLMRLAMGMFFDSYREFKKTGRSPSISMLITQMEVDEIKASLEADKLFLQSTEDAIRAGNLSARKKARATIDKRLAQLVEEGEEDNKDRIDQLKSLRMIYYGE